MPYLPDRPVDEEASLRSVQQGGLPLRAIRRINELLGTPGAPFTSTLTPSETVVARATSLHPISQVMGASVMHVGWIGQWNTWDRQGFELTQLTQARHEARCLALGRMRAEALLLGAHVVVGVEYRERHVPFESALLEVTVSGTAMRIAGAPPVAEPPLTLLDADELWKLHTAGYWPTGIAMGSCYWYEPHCDCTSEGSWASGPLPAHTRAVRSARDIATHRFREHVGLLKADGVVGVKTRRWAHGHEVDGHTRFHVDIFLMGTAVVRRGDAIPPKPPMVVLDLTTPPGQKPHHAHRRKL